jgi:hypothetical protein
MLCDVCQRLLENIIAGIWLNSEAQSSQWACIHHPTFESFCRSRRRNCNICNRLWKELPDDVRSRLETLRPPPIPVKLFRSSNSIQQRPQSTGSWIHPIFYGAGFTCCVVEYAKGLNDAPASPAVQHEPSRIDLSIESDKCPEWWDTVHRAGLEPHAAGFIVRYLFQRSDGM